jgi:hypothetical protein
VVVVPERWTMEELRALRDVTDPVADALAEEFIDRPVADLFNGVLNARYASSDDADPVIAAWLAERPDLPEWADRDRLAKGAEFFAEYGVHLGLGLFLSSLPLAYASHDGVQVLALTARLQTDANRRVMESAQFVLDVTTPGALEPGAQGYQTCRMVRLMHAGVRHLIHHHGRIPRTSDASVWPRWDPAWGEPINQQHMLGAMLSFSSSLLHVLDKLNVVYDPQGAEDYCHLWNVVGWLLGVDPAFLPLDRASMDALEVQIRELNEFPSEQGAAMTAALLKLVRSFQPIPGFDGFPVALMRLYIGDATADLLGVPKPNWTRFLVGFWKDASRMMSVHQMRDKGVQRMVAWFSRRVLTGFVETERHGDRPSFTIPDHLGGMVRR